MAKANRTSSPSIGRHLLMPRPGPAPERHPGRHRVGLRGRVPVRLAAGSVGVAALLGTAVVDMGGPAAAQYGPSAECTLTATPTAVFAGQPFTVTVTVGPGEFSPGGTAPVLISGQTVPLGSIAIPTSGSASATFTAPTSIGPGLHTITVDACSATLATSVTVSPSSSPGSATAATTPVATAPVATTPASAFGTPVATVAPASPSSSSTLAFTGADLAATIALGAVAIGGGGGIVLLARRRRSRA